MSVKSYWYTNFFKQIWQNSPAYTGWKPTGGDTFKVALYPPAYKPNQDTHISYNDIIQVSGQGYTVGGQPLLNKTISMATGSLVLGASPVSWAGCVFTVRGAVIYDDTNSGSLNKQLVRWMDFGQDIQLAGGTIEITFNGEGEVIITPPPGDTTPPQLANATVNATSLVLAYDELLDTTSVPATSSFAVTVNAISRTVSTVSIASQNVTLTITPAVVLADVVVASYTVPGTNFIRDTAFNPAASFSRQNILNVTEPSPPDPPQPDVTPPVVAITFPANLATISNTITVTATATDATGVVSTVLYIDGVAFSTDTSSPYSFGLDTTSLSNGAHTLIARAIDPAGNIGVSSTVNVTVSNVVVPPPDTTPPTISITSPLAGAFLAGNFTVAVTASDNVGVVSATLLIDGASQGVDPSQPYSFTIATTSFAEGFHTLSATAIDAASNVGTSSSVLVTFDNVAPTLSTASINGATLALNYSEPLNPASVPLTSAFVVRTDGNTRTLNSITVSGIQVLITLAVPVLAANVVTVSYTAPTGGGATPVEDRAGNNAANLVNQAVTNQTPGDTTAPVITALTVNTASLTIQYSENMDTSSVPATSAFAITVNSVARTVNSVSISGQNVTLTLSSAVISSDTVIAAYTQPATGKIRDIGQNNAASFFNLPVTNITAAPPTDLASFVSQFIPSLSMTVGTSQNVSVTMRNDGTATWTAAGGYHLYSQNPSGTTRWSTVQVPVQGSVLANGNAAFPFQITAPSTAGSYAFQWRMRHTATEFGSQSQNTTIVVNSPPPSGQELYVSTTGSDSNPGTLAQPMRTVNGALARTGYGTGLGAGRSVILLDGVYAETLLTWPSGISGSPFVLKALNRRGAIIRPNTTSSQLLLINTGMNQHLRFEGIVTDGVNVNNNNLVISGATNDITFYDIELKNVRLGGGSGSNSWQGVYSEGSRITVMNSFLHDIAVGLAQPFSHAIYMQGDNCRVEGNTIFNVAGNGVQFYSEHTQKPDSGIICRNLIYSYGLSGEYGQGVYCSSGTSNQVFNNVIYQPVSRITRGIALRSGNSAYFNTVYQNGVDGIEVEGSNITVRDNICYLNGVNINTSGSGSGYVASNNLTSNPFFVNATAANFHLQVGSAAIGNGVAISGIVTDFDGVTRGNPPDIGAYEFV